MTSAPDNSNYLLTAGDAALSHYHVLTAINGLVFTPGAAQGTATIEPGGKLALLQAVSTTGYLHYNNSTNALGTRAFSSTSTVAVTNGTGAGGPTTFDVIAQSSVQKINLQVQGDAVGSAYAVNLIGVDSIGITGQVDNINHRINLYISNAGGGGALPSYLCQNDTDLPTDAINLGATNAVLGVGLDEPVYPVDVLSSNAVDDVIYSLNSVSDAGADVNYSGGINLTTYGGPVDGAPEDIGYCLINMNAAGGSLASPEGVLADQILCSVTVNSYGETEFGRCGYIRLIAEGNHADDSHPTAWKFYTCQTGEVNPYLALTIDSSQNMTAEGQLTAARLHVTAPISVGVYPSVFEGHVHMKGDLLLDGTLLNTVLSSHGGTGLTSYTAGDMLYYASGTALSKLTLSATANQVLTNTGSSAPAWSGGAATSGDFLKYNGTNVVWAALPTTLVAGGGTGLTSYTAGDLLYYASGTALSKLALSATAHQVLMNDGSGAPIWRGGAATTGDVFTYNGTTGDWAAPTGGSGTVTSITLASADDTIFISGTNPITTSGTVALRVTSGIYPRMIATGGAGDTLGNATGITTFTTITTTRAQTLSWIFLTIKNVTGTLITTPGAWVENLTAGSFEIHVDKGGATSLDVSWFILI